MSTYDPTAVRPAPRPMRRADREVLEASQIADILEHSQVVHVSYEDGEGQTVIPVHFAYEYRPEAPNRYDRDGRGRRGTVVLYMHSAREGRKMDAIAAADNALPVAFEMECDQVIYAGRTPCASATAFRSIVGTGTAMLIEEPAEKTRVLDMLTNRLVGQPFDRPEAARAVAVWKIESDSFTAKHHPMLQA